MIILKPVLYYYSIQTFNRSNSGVNESLYWDGMSLETLTKWTWYFEYRAALLKVKYPRIKVESRWGNYEATGKKLMDIYEARKLGKTRTISKYKNMIAKSIENWDQLFPIEDDVLYKKAIAKIERLELEFAKFMEEEYNPSLIS